MPRLSIVVPFLGNLDLLEDTLVSVLENRPEACQIVVVLNEGYDDPYGLHGEVAFVASRPDAGLLGGIYRGLLACDAPIVHVLACGMSVTSGWAEVALPHFDNPQVGAVAPLVLSSARPDRVVSAGLAYDREGRIRCLSAGRPATRPALKHRPCGPDARAAFYRRSALGALTDWHERQGPAMVGIDLALGLRQQGCDCVVEPDCRTFAPPCLNAPVGAFRTGLEEARLFWRWASRHGWSSSVASHAALLVNECFSGLVWPPRAIRAAGRLAGGLEAALPGKRARRGVSTSAVPEPHFSRSAAPRQLVTATAARGALASNRSEICSSGPAAPRRAPG